MTIPNIIRRAEISQYLAVKALKRGGLFGGGTPSYLPSLLYQVRKNVSYMYDLDPTNANLVGNANYLYALCGIFGVQATNFISGGGTVIITPSIPSIPSPIEFVVDAGTTPIIAGASTLYIPTFIGYNMIFVRGGLTQIQVDNGGSYYTWNKTTGNFVCYGAANLGEEFSLNAI